MFSDTLLTNNIAVYVLALIILKVYNSIMKEKLAINKNISKYEIWGSVLLTVLSLTAYFRFFYVNYMENINTDAYIGVLTVFYTVLIPYSILMTLISGFRKKWIVIVAAGYTVIEVLLMIVITYIAA